MAAQLMSRSGKCVLTISLLFCLLKLTAVTAQAQIPVTSCGTDITKPGDYILINNLSNCPRSGIFIAADVKLFLNGHTISGTGNGTGIELGTKGQAEISGPGTITNFAVALLVGTDGGKPVRVTQVLATGNRSLGFYAVSGSKVVFQHDTAIASGTAFAVDSNESDVTDNTATDNESGIVVGGQRNRIVHNVANNNSFKGISIRGSDNEVRSNTALGNANYDLFDWTDCHNRWIDNNFRTANQPCIH